MPDPLIRLAVAPRLSRSARSATLPRRNPPFQGGRRQAITPERVLATFENLLAAA